MSNNIVTTSTGTYQNETRQDRDGNDYTVQIPVSTPVATPPAPPTPPAGITPSAGIAGAPATTDAVASPYLSRYDKNIADLTDQLSGSTPSAAPDLATITAQKQADAQSQIDAINKAFGVSLDAENKAGGARNARVHALNVSSGLGGSTFGSAAAQNQEDENKHAVDLMTSENDAKVQALLAGVTDQASDAYQKQLSDYRASISGDLDAETKLRDDQRKQATDTFSGLASAGITLDALKANEPDVYKQLASQFGGSDLELKAAYNNALPANMQTNYTTVVQKGANGNAVIHRYGLNPLTKTLDQGDYDTGQNYEDFTNAGSDIKEIGGAIYRVAKDGSTLTRLASVEPTAKAAGAGSSTGTLDSATVAQFNQQLNDKKQDANGYSVKGADGYVDPDQYQNALARWIQLGGSQVGFLRQFPPANYINPVANPSLPTYLRNTKNQPKTPDAGDVNPFG